MLQDLKKFENLMPPNMVVAESSWLLLARGKFDMWDDGSRSESNHGTRDLQLDVLTETVAP